MTQRSPSRTLTSRNGRANCGIREVRCFFGGDPSRLEAEGRLATGGGVKCGEKGGEGVALSSIADGALKERMKTKFLTSKNQDLLDRKPR